MTPTDPGGEDGGGTFEKRLAEEIREIEKLKQRMAQNLERLTGPRRLREMLVSREATLGFLGDPDPNARCAAVFLLTDHWPLSSDVPEILDRILATESDQQVRCVVLSGYGRVFRESRDQRVCRLLAEIISDDTEALNVREAAYRALYMVVGRPLWEWPPVIDFIFPDHVDWAFVRRCLGIE